VLLIILLLGIPGGLPTFLSGFLYIIPFLVFKYSSIFFKMGISLSFSPKNFIYFFLSLPWILPLHNQKNLAASSFSPTFSLSLSYFTQNSVRVFPGGTHSLIIM